MSRRSKSKEIALFESITGLIALGLLCYLFSPAFRSAIQIILLTAVIIGLIALMVWMVYKEFKNEPSPAFKIIYSELDNQTTSSSHGSPAEETSKYARPVPKPTISEKLRKIDWFQFEKLVELIYQHRGFSVKRLGGANPDGGVDLIVTSSEEKFVVQCKHWKKWTVGVRHIREFLGTLTDSGISRGVYITLKGYTNEAKQLADKHEIKILDEVDIIEMLVESGHVYSKEISELLSNEHKFCPKCGNNMVVRTARMSRNQFWGCSSFPRCKGIIKFPAPSQTASNSSRPRA